jgi:hypothetical protein
MEKILSSRSFRLTWALSEGLNDWNENVKGDANRRRNMFLGCFNYGQENMAMWGLYGIPWDEAIRIYIPNGVMHKWIGHINAQIKDGANVELQEIYLSDIAYISGKWMATENKFYHGTSGSITLYAENDIPLSSFKSFTGIIKNKAWAYENEVRIIGISKGKTLQNSIDIEMPDFVLSKMKITLGPNFKKASPEEIKEIVLSKYDINIKIQKSEFEDQVHFRSLCMDCVHEEYEKKVTPKI